MTAASVSGDSQTLGSDHILRGDKLKYEILTNLFKFMIFKMLKVKPQKTLTFS